MAVRTAHHRHLGIRTRKGSIRRCFLCLDLLAVIASRPMGRLVSLSAIAPLLSCRVCEGRREKVRAALVGTKDGLVSPFSFFFPSLLLPHLFHSLSFTLLPIAFTLAHFLLLPVPPLPLQSTLPFLLYTHTHTNTDTHSLTRSLAHLCRSLLNPCRLLS